MAAGGKMPYLWPIVFIIFFVLCAAVALVHVRVYGRKVKGRWRLLAAALIPDALLLGVVAVISVWRFDGLWQVVVSILYLVVQSLLFRRRLGQVQGHVEPG
jgi:hypothetical protein